MIDIIEYGLQLIEERQKGFFLGCASSGQYLIRYYWQDLGCISIILNYLASVICFKLFARYKPRKLSASKILQVSLEIGEPSIERNSKITDKRAGWQLSCNSRLNILSKWFRWLGRLWYWNKDSDSILRLTKDVKCSKGEFIQTAEMDRWYHSYEFFSDLYGTE